MCVSLTKKPPAFLTWPEGFWITCDNRRDDDGGDDGVGAAVVEDRKHRNNRSLGPTK